MVQPLNQLNQIDGYNLIRQLGEGANGTVYLVKKQNSTFAMKVFKFDAAKDQHKL